MFAEEYTKITVNHANYKYYLNLGYNVIFSKDNRGRPTVKNQEINVKTVDIPHGSGKMVDVICDYCGDIYLSKIANIYIGRKRCDKDCCTKCRYKKSNETKINKYGTSSTKELSKILHFRLGRDLKYSYGDIVKECKSKQLVLHNDTGDFAVKDEICCSCMIHPDEKVIISVESLFKNTYLCKKCMGTHLSEIQSKTTIDDVKNICRSKNYDLITTEVHSCDDTVEFICNKHKDYGIQTTSYYGLLKNKALSQQMVDF